MARIKQALVSAGLWLHDHETLLRVVTGVLVIALICLVIMVVNAFQTFFLTLALLGVVGFVVYMVGGFVWALIDS